MTERDTEHSTSERASQGPSLSDFRDDPTGWAVFFDIDGTLLDIAPSPNGVVVPSSLLENLTKLERLVDGALALITGRDIEFVDKLFAPHRFVIAGLHGAERRESDGQTVRAPDDPTFPAVKSALRQWTTQLPNVGFEEKGAAVALHYRREPKAAHLVEQLMEKALAMAGPAYHLQAGKMVIELKPRADKGEAITSFMQSEPFKGRRPIAFGDDDTDETMFERINELGGLSIRIGNSETLTKATCRIISPACVRDLIEAATGRIT